MRRVERTGQRKASLFLDQQGGNQPVDAGRDTPELLTDFLENTIGGIGEVGPVCVPAALCNALFAATGKRHRRLPLARSGVFTVYGKIYS